MPTPCESTPGQVAYAAYFAMLYVGEPHLRPVTWRRLTTRHRRAWEAAAGAVLTDYLESVARLCAQELAAPQEEETHG